MCLAHSKRSINCSGYYSHYFQNPLAGGSGVPGASPALQGHGRCLTGLCDSGPGSCCCVNHQPSGRLTLGGSRPGSRNKIAGGMGLPTRASSNVIVWRLWETSLPDSPTEPPLSAVMKAFLSSSSLFWLVAAKKKDHIICWLMKT